jgi:hypothetical protein
MTDARKTMKRQRQRISPSEALARALRAEETF